MSKVKLVDRDLGFSKLFANAKAVKNSKVRVGVFDSGEADPDGGLTVAELALIHEYGTDDGHIPARSFVRSTFDAKRAELAAMGEKLIVRVIEGKVKIDAALNALGAKLADDIKRAVTTGAGIPPPNAPAAACAWVGCAWAQAWDAAAVSGPWRLSRSSCSR